jgi:hypothetical protein
MFRLRDQFVRIRVPGGRPMVVPGAISRSVVARVGYARRGTTITFGVDETNMIPITIRTQGGAILIR